MPSHAEKWLAEGRLAGVNETLSVLPPMAPGFVPVVGKVSEGKLT